MLRAVSASKYARILEMLYRACVVRRLLATHDINQTVISRRPRLRPSNVAVINSIDGLRILN